MAVYKVIQDIESEDKLLGPLTLKGFVYAAIAGISAFIEVRIILSGGTLLIKLIFMFIFALPMILFGVLASPLGREQPTEVWLLSRIRFFFKPRKRVWDQEGMSELVTITAPKKPDLPRTKGLSPTEVQSRLKTLTQTLDTRGWAIKNTDVNISTPDSDINTITPASDRLVGSGGVPQQMPVVDVHAADDILDEKNNPTAQKFEALMQKADSERKQGLLTLLKDIIDDSQPAETSKKTSDSKSPKDSPVTKAAVAKNKDENWQKKQTNAEKQDELQKQLDETASKFANGPHAAAVSKAEAPQAPPVTAASQTVNMELAQSGNAFSVATLSQLANRQPTIEQTGPGEVTISLH